MAPEGCSYCTTSGRSGRRVSSWAPEARHQHSNFLCDQFSPDHFVGRPSRRAAPKPPAGLAFSTPLMGLPSLPPPSFPRLPRPCSAPPSSPTCPPPSPHRYQVQEVPGRAPKNLPQATCAPPNPQGRPGPRTGHCKTPTQVSKSPSRPISSFETGFCDRPDPAPAPPRVTDERHEPATTNAYTDSARMGGCSNDRCVRPPPAAGGPCTHWSLQVPPRPAAVRERVRH